MRRPGRRHTHATEEHENHERWLITYADMITLLLALFMMLYAMSVLDLKKFQAFQESFKTGKGKHVHALPGKGDPKNGKLSSQNPGDPKVTKVVFATKPVAPSTGTQPLKEKSLAELAKEIEAAAAAAHLTGDVTVRTEKRGLVISVHTASLFDSGKAALRPDGVRLLRVLAPPLVDAANPFVIEGHTDNVPIHTAQFPSNWELSTARATTVLHYLMGRYHVADGRLTAAGYADTRPIVPNDTPAHRQQNRRVEIVVLPPPG